MREDLYQSVLENLYEGVYLVDPDRRITFWNRGAERMTGFQSDELVGRLCSDNVLNHIDGKSNCLCRAGCPLHQTIKDGAPREATVYLHHKSGQRLEVAVRTIPLIEDGKIVGAAEFFVDDAQKDELCRTIEELKGLALLDPLTNLPNRRYLGSYLENRLNEYHKLDISFSAIIMDIDHFKQVNDTYGHDTGDLVLMMLSETLRDAFRKNDIIGRWGGEEFLAAITGVSQEDLFIVCEKIRMLVKSSSLRSVEPPLSVSISVGASVISENDTLSTLLKRADDALFVSKKAGRDRCTVH